MLEALQARSGEIAAYFREQRIDLRAFTNLIHLYAAYRQLLEKGGTVPNTDFSLIQQLAYNAVCKVPDAGRIFKHIIIDEYQDTNTIQERLFFKLAEGYRNICVVGDDDQALYRFRGATVANFV